MLNHKTVGECAPKMILQIFFQENPIHENVYLGNINFLGKDGRKCVLDFQSWKQQYDGNALILTAMNCLCYHADMTYDELKNCEITDLFLQGEEDIMVPEGQGIVDMTLTLLDDETNTPIVRFTKEHLKNTDLGEYYDFIN